MRHGGLTGAPASATVRRLGALSWSVLGMIALAAVVAAGLSAISGIVVPLVIALIIGSLLQPGVEWLERHRVKPLLAVLLAMVTALAGVALSAVIVVRGLIGELPQIKRQMLLGWTSLLDWGRSLNLDAALLDRIRLGLDHYLPDLGRGLLGVVSGTLSGAIAFAFGGFFAFFLLFFMLRDLRAFPRWLARLTRADLHLVDTAVGTVQASLRGYFRGVAITALVTAPIFMIPLLVLRIPLAVPIFILYFVLSFIPFLGAWITGAVAVLVAFGSGGVSAALIIAVTFVISNGTIQSAVSSWALGSALRLHPVAVLLATMIGGTIAGMLGMVLGAPLLAATALTVRTIRSGSTAEPAGQT